MNRTKNPGPEEVETAPAAAAEGGSISPIVGTSKSSRYAWSVLAVLFLVQMSSFADRQILSVVLQPIKAEMNLQDWQLGMLTGITFALFYVLVGIPIARLADRSNRVKIVGICVLVWSAMTMLSGSVRTFAHLTLCRIGVAVGEGGAGPAAHSLIADYFPPQKRASALSVYSAGISVGVLLGSMLGGLIAQHWGWRWAFLVLGLPGIPLALLVYFFIKEPVRGGLDPNRADQSEAVPSFADVIRTLWGRPAAFHMMMGAAISAFAAYGISAFAPSYFVRMFDLELGTVGFIMGISSGLFGGLGTLLGGFLSDRFARKDLRAYAYVAAIGTALGMPLYILAYLQENWVAAFALLAGAGIGHILYLAPMLGVIQNSVEPKMRATASSILYLLVNLIGLGLGPVAVGLLSDFYASMAYEGSFSADCARALVMTDGCLSASATGLRWAILSATSAFILSLTHFLLAARSMRRDLAHTTGK